MTANYNKKRHLQLFKQRSMGDNSNWDELLGYSCILQNQLEWEIHDQYLESIEEFLKENISMPEFFAKLQIKNYSIMDFEHFKIAFSRLWKDSMKEDATFPRDLKRVKNFQHNPRSDRFCSFITAVLRQFEVFEDKECTEQEVKDYVRYILQEIQPHNQIIR